MIQQMKRYGVIKNKYPREILLLRGKGCKWRGCTFCDYHLDASQDERANFILNKQALDQVTGEFGVMEIVNSGSVTELDKDTWKYISKVCADKKIFILIFEAHWMYRDALDEIRSFFKTVDIKFKVGVETFDIDLRERVLNKNFGSVSPIEIAKYFQHINLLQGIVGQTVESMTNDIKVGLKYFERLCVNVMQENSKFIKPDLHVISDFKKYVYPKFIDESRVDILLNNTDFGIGEKE